MREPAFLKRNKEKWKSYEEKLKQIETMPPDEQAEIYTELTDDLAYVRTYYPKSKTAKYVNQLAVKVHQSIYKNKKERKNRILDFWKQELPLLFYEHQKTLLFSFIIFALAIAVGALSTVNDGTFVRLIMGDHYVNMTLDNIEKGDPLAVYKSSKEMEMFMGITINNVRVSFYAMVLGIVFVSIGTGFILFKNGIMVGAFFAFLIQEGAGKAAFLTVMIHGTLELSAIVIAGCAGFVVGNSILFPKTHSRMSSFKTGARKAVKISIGLVPVFVVAGFLESFVTRHYQFNWIINVIIIVLSAIFIIWYFILYPIQVHNKLAIEAPTNQVQLNSEY